MVRKRIEIPFDWWYYDLVLTNCIAKNVVKFDNSMKILIHLKKILRILRVETLIFIPRIMIHQTESNGLGKLTVKLK